MTTQKWLVLAAVFFAICATATAQPSTPRPPKEIFLDSDGKQISNNEFVDIRMANPNYKDATRIETLPDGTKEFHLQKVPQEGMPAPVFTLKTIDGKKISSEDLRGKVIVLNLWFIGCPACYRQEGVLSEARAKIEDKDVVFLAATADPANDVKRYIRARPSLLTHAGDAKAMIGLFAVSTFPRSMVISKEGKIVYWRTTIHAKDKLESVIRAELAKP